MLHQRPMWVQLRGPKTRGADLDLQKNGPCLALISQLVNLHWIHSLHLASFQPDECNDIYQNTSSLAVVFSYGSDIIVPDTKLCLHLTQEEGPHCSHAVCVCECVCF